MSTSTKNFIKAFDFIAGFIWGFFTLDAAPMPKLRETAIKLLTVMTEGYDQVELTNRSPVFKTAVELLHTTLNASFLQTKTPIWITIENGVLITSIKTKYANKQVACDVQCDIATLMLSISVDVDDQNVFKYGGFLDDYPEAEQIQALKTGFTKETGDPIKVALCIVLIAVITQQNERSAAVMH